MAKENQVRLWAPVEFRQFLYSVKAQHPNKTLDQIMRDMAKQGKRNVHEKKKVPFWGKI